MISMISPSPIFLNPCVIFSKVRGVIIPLKSRTYSALDLDEEFLFTIFLPCLLTGGKNDNGQESPSTRGKGHFFTPPASLFSEIFMGVNVLFADPSASIFIFEEFQRTGRHVAAELGVVFHSWFIRVFHDRPPW